MPIDAVPSSAAPAVRDPEASADAAADPGVGGAIVIAGVLIGLSLLLSSHALTRAMDRSGSLLAQVLKQTEVAIGAASERPVGLSTPTRE